MRALIGLVLTIVGLFLAFKTFFYIHSLSGSVLFSIVASVFVGGVCILLGVLVFQFPDSSPPYTYERWENRTGVKVIQEKEKKKETNDTDDMEYEDYEIE